jgi:S1-C subfamily serine protease
MRRCIKVTLFVLAIALLAAACSGGDEAATTTVTTTATTTQPTDLSGVVLNDVSDLVAQVRSGVVAVTETGVAYDIFMRPVEQQGSGTGIVIDDNGHILTNHHVIADADTVTVIAEDGRDRSAQVIFGNPARDLAVLQIEDTDGLVPLPLGDSDAMQVGDPVVAIGNALALDATSLSVSVGIVSAVGRTIETDQAVLENLIQTDAAINPGNSGGPLLNAAGEVIGINTAIATDAQNIGFSISINSVKDDVDNAIAGIGVPYIGVSIINNSVRLATRYRLPTSDGVVIISVLPTSPASDAGLAAGDIILAVNGQTVDSVAQVNTAVADAGTGSVLVLTTQRGQTTADVSVTVAER